MPGYDLHTHSTFSDGTSRPAENVRLAVDRGLEGLGVTDHDTTDGIDEAVIAAADELAIVPGLELSAEHDGTSLHVLGYWVDPDHDGLRDELRRLHDTRFRRGELIVDRLRIGPGCRRCVHGRIRGIGSRFGRLRIGRPRVGRAQRGSGVGGRRGVTELAFGRVRRCGAQIGGTHLLLIGRLLRIGRPRVEHVH